MGIGEMGLNKTAADCNRMSQVQDQVVAQCEKLGAMETLLADVVARLESVLVDQKPVEVDSGKTEEKLCQLADQLRSNNMAILRFNNRLRDILDRLEV